MNSKSLGIKVVYPFEFIVLYPYKIKTSFKHCKNRHWNKTGHKILWTAKTTCINYYVSITTLVNQFNWLNKVIISLVLVLELVVRKFDSHILGFKESPDILTQLESMV